MKKNYLMVQCNHNNVQPKQQEAKLIQERDKSQGKKKSNDSSNESDNNSKDEETAMVGMNRRLKTIMVTF